MNRLHYLLFLYVIVRDIGASKDPIISTGFMRQTGPPWKTGKGIQLRISKYVIQFGVCRARKEVKNALEDEGLLYAMQARLLDEEPNKIGSW